LIEALDGMAADDINGSFKPGECVVNTERLCPAVRASLRLQLLDKPWLRGADCTFGGSGNFRLHFPKNAIEVPLFMHCSPHETYSQTTMSVERDGGVPVTRLPQSGPWVTRQEP